MIYSKRKYAKKNKIKKNQNYFKKKMVASVFLGDVGVI